MSGGKLTLKEIHRFDNIPVRDGSHHVWDVAHIFDEIRTGMKKCAQAGITPVSVSVDTWGVDYALLDAAGERIGKAHSYRDRRTEGMVERFDAVMSPPELYGHTGIQRILINTLYQLMAHMDEAPGDFDRARHLLMMPDYFHFLLAGEMCSEYTIATTSGLVNAGSQDWDDTVIAAGGVPRSLFGSLHLPGTRVGKLQKAIADEVGFSCDVVLPCAHDTASAVVAMPAMAGVADREPLYISSGTWSLIGCESEAPLLSDRCRELNYTNEGGSGHRYRLLQNSLGLWMIQSVRRELAPEMSFGEVARAAEAAGIDTIVDCEDQVFFAPDSMYGAVRGWCSDHVLTPPEGIGETAAVIYRSLAASYAGIISELAEITGRNFTDIHVLGGGSNVNYLNSLTAKKTGMAVHAGPSEATAIGNIAVQMISDGVFSNINEARSCIADSFSIRKFNGVEYDR
jgi:rhamnulokinase